MARSARTSGQDREETGARDVGRDLVQSSPVRTHDFPRDERPSLEWAKSLDQEVNVTPPPRDSDDNRAVRVAFESLGDEVGDGLSDALGVPFAIEVTA